MRHKRIGLVALFLLTLAALPAAQERYSNWSSPVHLDSFVNTVAVEVNPVLSKDGLTLYFQRNYSAGVGPYYMYVTHRASLDSPWFAPEYLGDVLGDGLFLSNDGHRAFFSRKASDGKDDIYMSRRRDNNDDSGWSEPESLGSSINTSANEYYPSLYEDEATGTAFLYFTSDRAGNDDIYAAELQEDGSLGPAVAVTALNTSTSADRRVRVRRDGLECVLMSNRQGSMPNQQDKPSWDLWVATRASTSEAWSKPVNLGDKINTGRHDGGPSYSFDGSELYFHGAQRLGNFDGGDVLGVGCPFSATCYFDIWVATRQKANGNGEK